MVHITFDGTPPSTQHLYGHKGSMVFMKKEGRDYKEACQWVIKSKFKEKPIKDPITVIIELYFTDKRKRDVDNFNKIILDSGSKLLWVDDSQIQELIIRKFLGSKAKVELFIMQ